MENQIDSIHQKTLIWYLMYVEKTNNLLVNNKSRKRSSERREKKMTIEDLIKKTFLPLTFMVFFYCLVYSFSYVLLRLIRFCFFLPAAPTSVRPS